METSWERPMTEWALAIVACLWLCGAAAGSTIDLHVAPNGPLATLRVARDAARRIGPDKPRRIVVHGGAYYLSETLVLQAQDSGLTIEAAAGQKPVVVGGRRLSGWRPDGDHLWSAKLPQIDGGNWDFRMLVVNGRFCKRARLPKTGTFTHLSEFKVPWMSTTGGGWKRKPTRQELTTLKYRPADLGPWLDLKNAELTVYHMWDESVVGLSAMNEKTHTLTFSNPSGHPPGAFRVKKYVVWNVREGMTEPGQWFLDRTAGKVVYWPLPGEDMARAEVVAPVVECIIRLNGSKDALVKDVTIRGLTLSVTNTPLVAGGFGAGKFDGAVSAVHTESCRLVDLTVFNVGGQGIKTWQCNALRVEGCHVRDTGACGVKTGGVDVRITNNHVHDVGRTYPSAIAVWCNGKRARIVHNEIHDTPYTAVACGGDEHCIEANLIYRAMKELHDGAGIYITFCKKVVLRGNLIRDIVETGGYGASAYYLDEQAEGCVVEKNVSVRVDRPSHNHMARDNVIRNNVFICDGEAKLTFPKCSAYRFEKNVICAKGKIALSNPSAIDVSSDNVLFSETGTIDGCPAGAVRADPRVVGSERGVFGFAPGSPALELGIEPVDVRAAGRTSHREE